MPTQSNDVRPTETRPVNPSDGDSAPVLKKLASDFGRRGVVLIEGGCTTSTSTCSCLHIVGAIVGAVVGLTRGLAQVQGAPSEGKHPPPFPAEAKVSSAPPPSPTAQQPARDSRPNPDAAFSPGLVFLGLASIVGIVSVTALIIYGVANITRLLAESPDSLNHFFESLLLVAFFAPSVLLLPVCAIAVAITYLASSRDTAAANVKAALHVSGVTLGYSFLGMILGGFGMVGLFMLLAML